MSISENKAAEFAERLWNNPSLQGLSPLQKEEQLHTFIQTNAAVLKPTMASKEFFPDLPWQEVQHLLMNVITSMANQDMHTLQETLLDRFISFDFIYSITDSSLSNAEFKKIISEYLKTILEKPESRREISGPLIAISVGVVDRYVSQIISRQQYVSIVLTKVQHLRIAVKQIADFIKVTMLLRPLVHYFSPNNSRIQYITSAYADKVLQESRQLLKFMPDILLESGINSLLSFQEYPHIDGISRLASIFSQRCRHLKTGIQLDKGAETSDKSWFSVARKNYRYFGFDLDMLYELQNIASDNGW
ncbi:MAG: hypothetical protein B0D92_02630 [Spirochaeta sp. LUC14_002_19_P3]|nr:MAG: hypothetical protein B0D92_02630 [Spirochaeta sp. LUC14_002_19_P3]